MNTGLNRFPLPCNISYWLILSAVAIVISTPSFAVIETYRFSKPENRIRYQWFVDELRCPKCQNQNLSGSNSPIAKDLRRHIHRMVESGYEDKQIKAFMVKRYGNFVLYKPPFDIHTVILWLFPLFLLIAALIAAFVQRKKHKSIPSDSALNADEKQLLQSILRRYE